MAKKMIEVTTVRESNVVSAGGAPHIMGASFANAGATADAAHYLFSFETERGVNAAELAVKTQKEVNRGTVAAPRVREDRGAGPGGGQVAEARARDDALRGRQEVAREGASRRPAVPPRGLQHDLRQARREA